MKLILVIITLLLSKGIWAQGLKRVDYQNKTTETHSSTTASASGLSELSPEEQKKLLESIETLKAKQQESQKILHELDKDE